MDEPNTRPGTRHRIEQEARDWIVRLTSGDVTEADLARFTAWQDLSVDHRQAFDRERMFWRQLQVFDGHSDGMPPFCPAKPEPAFGRRVFLAGSGAAALAATAVIAAPRLGLWWSADHVTGIGQSSEVTLPDGSVAALNTDSAIALDFTRDLRLVRLLKGEAEFHVKPSTSLFRVAALAGNSDTTEAAFTVKSVEEQATVTVATGAISVSGPAAPEANAGRPANAVALSAGDQTTYTVGSPPVPAVPVDVEVMLAWRKGRVIFEGQPFASAIAELGRYVPERVVLAPGIDGTRPVSAIFSTHEALAAVQAIAATQGLSARRIPGVLLLIS